MPYGIDAIDRHADKIPVPIYDMLVELGIGPVFRPLAEEISGWIEKRPDGVYAIVINNTHSENRQRFTAAHELGHYLYHRSLLGEGVSDNRAYRQVAGTGPQANALILPMHERQANSFAAHILMPQPAIARLKSAGIEDIADMAKMLKVSPEAMRIRLGMRY